MIKECDNCHHGMETILEHDCFAGCFNDPDHPDWEPMTNGDKMRLMSDEELADVWGITEFEEKHIPECADIPVGGNGCKYTEFLCEACPKTFLNWLKSAAKEG